MINIEEKTKDVSDDRNKIVLFWKEREDCHLDGEHQDPLGCQAKFYF